MVSKSFPYHFPQTLPHANALLHQTTPAGKALMPPRPQKPPCDRTSQNHDDPRNGGAEQTNFFLSHSPSLSFSWYYFSKQEFDPTAHKKTTSVCRW